MSGRASIHQPSRRWWALLSLILAATTNVAKIVLIAPGSVTHHTDMHQRYIELVSAVDPLQPQNNCRRLAYMPANDKIAPHGYYMLFAVTNQGAPSNAIWVVIV